MITTTTDDQRVPGASLYYEARGSGPILLMIAAGAGDADSYQGIAAILADQYTVVTYDRRGYSRSPLDDPEQAIEIETHADDAHRLLAALSADPACVFGCSIGALIGLALAVQHPEQLGRLVAHEPPARQLMTDKLPVNPAQIARQQGGEAAIRQFAASLGIERGAADQSARGEANRQSFLRYDTGSASRFTLDLAALPADRIVVAGGRDGRQYFPYQCAVALAERLGQTVEEFPGGHAGFVDYPQEFAARLREVLSR